MNILLAIILVLSVVITALVLMQSKGAGLSIVPGSNDFGKFERRGAEKTLHNITIALIVIFIGCCALHYFFS